MPSQHSSRRAKPFQIWGMGLGLIFLALALAYLLVTLWPQQYPKFPPAGVFTPTGDLENTKEAQCLAGWCPGPDARLLAMVMIAGGLGTFVHIAKSFGDFVGNERFMASWIWWYILKPFIGMILAVVLYLIIRGGFLTVSSNSAAADGGTVNINLYGLMGMACLAGMFAKQATDKLGELFDILFKTAGKAKRADSVDNPVPILTEAHPPVIDAQTLYVTLHGRSFIRGAVVEVNGANRETRLTDSTQLAVQLLPEDVAQGSSLSVVVRNPPPGGGASAPMLLPLAAGAAAANLPPVGLAAPQAATAADEEDIDGCDCPIENETEDHDLPAATGGVQA